MTYNESSILQFVFEAAIGRSFESDIAIDFMVVMDGPCEGTHMFVRYSYIHSNVNLTFRQHPAMYTDYTVNQKSPFQTRNI